MARTYDVIVVGTGAGGGMALKTLAEAGLKVCVLNAGRRLDPLKDFRAHKRRYDMPFRGFGHPQHRGQFYSVETEYTTGLWDHTATYTTGEGTKWEWPRMAAVGGKTNFWGRSSARFGDIDFRAASLDGLGVDWPISEREIGPYYSRVERMIGVASTVQGRPSNPDGEYLPPLNYRCIDRILEGGCKKVGVPFLPDRVAQLTVDFKNHPRCHYCGNCNGGCDTGSFFSTPYFLLPDAEATGNVELRTDAQVREVLVDEEGRARGVAYVERQSKREVEVAARAVVVAASCVETAHIMLNSKSPRFPTGVANGSGQLGRNLCDHLYGTTINGFAPQLLGQPSFPDDAASGSPGWIPRWQNLVNPREEKFARGYSLYVKAGCRDYPLYHHRIEGYGAAFKRDIRRFYPTPILFYAQVPSLPSPGNYVDIDPDVKDIYGIPAVRVHFQWGPNELAMYEHAKAASAQIFHAAGCEIWDSGTPPYVPGSSLHETGTCRMGDDPRKFVTNSFGQTHEVPNLYCCDASIFPFPTDKTTTLSILAFTLRGAEHLIQQFKQGRV